MLREYESAEYHLQVCYSSKLSVLLIFDNTCIAESSRTVTSDRWRNGTQQIWIWVNQMLAQTKHERERTKFTSQTSVTKSSRWWQVTQLIISRMFSIFCRSCICAIFCRLLDLIYSFLLYDPYFLIRYQKPTKKSQVAFSKNRKFDTLDAFSPWCQSANSWYFVSTNYSYIPLLCSRNEQILWRSHRDITKLPALTFFVGFWRKLWSYTLNTEALGTGPSLQ